VSGLIRSIPETLSTQDRGLAYGDGLFETFAVRNNAPCFWAEHMQRLAEGCNRLGIPVPDPDALGREAAALCAESEGNPAVLKIILSRGQGGRGYRAPEEPRPWYGMSLYHAPEYPQAFYSEGVGACVCETRLSSNPTLAGIKHLNRLEQVLARKEFGDEYQEGLMLDGKGRVIEGTMSNLFLVIDDVLVTPEINECGVNGVTRRRLIEWARQQRIECRLSQGLLLEEVLSANALFVCNSVIGLWPIRQLEDKTYSVKHGMLRRLMNEFPALCD
jgi:4-amino-4-deoxychorismate lyase